MTQPKDAPKPGSPTSLPVLHSIATVAVRFNVSIKTVRRWIAAGLLPAHRLGRQLRIREVDLVTFLARSRQTYTGDH